MSANEVQSVADLVRPVNAGAHVVAAAFLGETAVFATGEGEVILGAEGTRIPAHPGGAVLAATSDGKAFFTAGDDGRLVKTAAEGSIETIAEAKGRWIDQVAIGPDGVVAWSAGKTAFVQTKKTVRSLEVASTVGGLAFAPKGLRLAIAHYNGATLWFPNAEVKPETLEWKGSHLGVAWSPDGRFLVTTMQENAMHGWRLADGKHMRMSGYPSRVRAMSFTADGKSLATSGAEAVIVWPFGTRDGPMGKEPAMIAPAREGMKVTCVACHPKREALAAGYNDGMVMMVRLSDGAEILARGPDGGEITALAWASRGDALCFGTDDGKAGVLVL
jgi:WD40 repeat protein